MTLIPALLNGIECWTLNNSKSPCNWDAHTKIDAWSYMKGSTEEQHIEKTYSSLQLKEKKKIQTKPFEVVLCKYMEGQKKTLRIILRDRTLQFKELEKIQVKKLGGEDQ